MSVDPRQEPANDGSVTVPVVWVGVEELPVVFVNQFLGVAQPNEVFLTMGTIVPPAILGATEEERKAQAESIQFVQVKPVARLALTAVTAVISRFCSDCSAAAAAAVVAGRSGRNTSRRATSLAW